LEDPPSTLDDTLASTTSASAEHSEADDDI